MTCDGGRTSERARVGALAGQVRESAPRLGTVRLVCVDGPAGSGKSSLAERLAGALDTAMVGGVAVLHLDDLYQGWSGLDGVAERLEAQVLAPLRRGEPGRWQRYDWGVGAFAEWHDLPVPDVLVVEGCGSADLQVARHAVLQVFVEAPPRVRLRRGLDRDGEAMREEWVRWQVRESAHFAAERTRERADVVVDGTAEPLP